MTFLCGHVLQTVEEIEGVLGRDLYPNLAEERSRWEKELAGLREENESLTAMLCSKEEELNRTKATMNAIREERDRLRRRVSTAASTVGPIPAMGLRGVGVYSQGQPRNFMESQSWESPALPGYEVILESSFKMLRYRDKI